MQRDPLGYVDGTNLHDYVAGGPATARDPSGLKMTKLEKAFWNLEAAAWNLADAQETYDDAIQAASDARNWRKTSMPHG